VAADLSIAIVTWNNASEILDCLDSIYQHAGELHLQVIIVDNGSRDPTSRLVEEHFPQASLLIQDGNIGFAAASNKALEQATGRNILLLNPDTTIQGNALQSMVEYLDSNPSVGAVGPQLIRPSGEVQRSCIRFASTKAVVRGFLTGGGYLPKDMYEPSSVASLSGAALMVKHVLVDEVGMLDPDFFMYGEDTDWCYRISLAGWEIHYLPTAKIVHIGGRSADQVPVQTYVRRRLSKLLFLRKHRSWWEYVLVARLMRLHIWLRWLGSAGTLRDYYRDVLLIYDQELRAFD
jgi:GT2 family glycosyltransferase